MSMRLLSRCIALFGAFGLLAFAGWSAFAVAPANEHFERVWARTDRPVAELAVSRTWMWGPDGNTGALQEPYSDSPGGFRTVQYFDKSRMEINHPNSNPDSLWYVTNGLLVNELMTGRMQRGNGIYTEHPPADISIAGDVIPDNGPTYAALAQRREDAPLPDGSVVTQRVDAQGRLSDDPALAGYGVTVAFRVQVPGIDHQIAAPFWEFMNASGLVFENGALVEATLFVNPFFATGFPVTEPMWVSVILEGDPTDVLLQCFERRCLTFTPSNDEGWQVENGNVGHHYYIWRYEILPADPTATIGPTATATSTSTPAATSTASPTATTAPAAGYDVAGVWGAASQPAQRMVGPAGVAVAAGGDVYVADAVADRIQVFSDKGVLLRSWGVSGDGPGELDGPAALALDGAGAVYVADRDNNRVVKYTTAGQFLTAWGTSGDGPGEFSGPAGVAVDGQGRVYVSDSGNHRMQRFTGAGLYIDAWGELGDGPGELSFPLGVAVASSGAVYVADSGNDRVQVFNANGGFSESWTVPSLVAPSSTATFSGGVLVADASGNRIYVFSAGGELLDTWGVGGSQPGQLDQPLGVAVGSNADVYVADFGNGRVQVFDVLGVVLDAWSDDERGRFVSPAGVALDASNGLAYVADRQLDKLVVFDLDSEFVRELTGLNEPCGVAVAAGGDVYVTETGGHKVSVFDDTGAPIDGWGSEGDGAGEFLEPTGLALDATGAVYVVDSLANRVQKFSATGALLAVWGVAGSGPGAFDEPLGIAVKGTSVFVVDSGNSRVQEFTLDGEFVRQWGTAGQQPGGFVTAAFLATNAAGELFVGDPGAGRIQHFTATGTLLVGWGLPPEDGAFEPQGLAVRADGAVLVADLRNAHVLFFEATD